jgi:hypothetical protein
MCDLILRLSPLICPPRRPTRVGIELFFVTTARSAPTRRRYIDGWLLTKCSDKVSLCVNKRGTSYSRKYGGSRGLSDLHASEEYTDH